MTQKYSGKPTDPSPSHGTVQRLGVWGRERYDGLCLFDRGIVHGLDFATGRNRPRHHGRWRRPDRDRSTHRPCRDRQSGADAVGGKTGSGAYAASVGCRAGSRSMRFSAPAAHPAMEYAISRTGDRIRSRLCSVVTVRLPRWLCTGCRRIETGMSWPSHCRSTPELDQLQAHLSALMSYRVAAGVLGHLLPVEASTSPETFRHHTLKIGEQLRDAALAKPAAAEPAISISLDSTFIRSRHDCERHLEVRVGNVETACGGRQVFGAVRSE